MKKILILALALVPLFLLPKITQAQNVSYVPGEIIVKLKANQVAISSDGKKFTGQTTLNNLNEKFKVQNIDKAIKDLDQRKDKVGLSRIYKLKLANNQDVLKAVEEYKQKPEVEWAEPNYIVKAALVPNDTYYASRQWNLTKISAPSAWDITTGSTSITVAIVDTGVDYNHPDLGAGFGPSYKVTGGYDFVNGDADPMDDQGHGTHCAGIASAITNNSTGIAGVSWLSKIMAIKVLDASGSGTDTDCASGIDYAASHGADVISMSWGGYGNAQVVSDAITNAYSSGCVLVGAAGNNNIQTAFYPAAYSDVIAVASTEGTDHKSYFSNYGNWVDVSAPGGDGGTPDIGDIYSTIWYQGSHTYTYAYGTSMACPHVSGLAALIKAQYPSLTNAQIVNQIKSKADNIDSLNPSYAGKLGTGRINAYKSLVAYSWQMISQTTDRDLTKLKPGDVANVTLTAKNTGNVTWSKSGPNPTNLGTWGPVDRSSAFYVAGNWLTPARPAAMNENSVAPGENATFNFQMKAPTQLGTYFERFNLVTEGITWMNDTGLGYYCVVSPSTYSWQFISQSASKSLVGLSPGETVTITLTAKNTGDTIWYRTGSNPVRVGTTNPRDRSSTFANGTWLGANRPVGLPDGTNSVAPNATVTFTWTYTAPARAGTYSEHFSLVTEGITWMNDPGVNYYTVVNGNYSWQFISQGADKNLAGLLPGEQATITLTTKNTGNTIWYRTGSNPVRVGTTNPRDRSSTFANGSWLGANRPVGLSVGTDSVAPGATVTFTWTITAPSTMGVYREYFSLVTEGITWMNDPGVNYYCLVGGSQTLEGIPLPAYSGLVGLEQHLCLTIAQELPATHYAISGTPLAAQNGMAWQTSGGSGFGAWGVAPPVNDERYYICMRWNYTNMHGQPILAPKNWYYCKKVLVINPANNNKLIASIIEYGPSPWTGRVSGLSPEAMLILGAVTDNSLNYYWALDQNLPPGPV